MSSFSPEPVGARKPSDSFPPMIPDSASTKYASQATALEDPLVRLRDARSKLASSPASSRSNEYESFMMNSRTRRSPPRGRGSSRSFVEKWYQTCGSSLYERISRAWNVIVSSCDSGRTNGRPAPSVRLEDRRGSRSARCLPELRRREDGQSISCPPIAFISSRMIWTTFWCTRQPSGRNVHSPAPTCRMKPPRTRSLWLAASASAGSSRRVGRKSCDARIRGG